MPATIFSGAFARKASFDKLPLRVGDHLLELGDFLGDLFAIYLQRKLQHELGIDARRRFIAQIQFHLRQPLR